jgi:thymidylate synthase (FAD)
MKIIEPYFEIQDDLDRSSLAVRLEACGRICYKSEDLITEDSAVPFVTKIAKHGHNSVLETAVVTLSLRCGNDLVTEFFACQPKYLIVDRTEDGLLVTGSIRSFRELYGSFPGNQIIAGMVSLLAAREPFLFEGVYDASSVVAKDPALEITKMSLSQVDKLPDDLLLRHRYVGVKFFVNRAVTHELVRHRPCSFLQESQRYCRYSQDKFDGQVTFIKPMFYEEGSEEYELWKEAMEYTEKKYLKLLETSSPQAARTVLPNSCKTEIIVYCNLVEWQHIFKLRTSQAAEPSMREIIVPLAEELSKRYPML